MERIALVLIWLGLLGNLAGAQDSGDPATLYAGADFVFAGRVEKIKPDPAGFTAQFKVDQLIKGLPAGNDTLIVKFPSEARCHSFKDTHSYLVYGRKIREMLWVDPCDGSKLVSQAEADLRYIHTVNKKVSEQCNHKRLVQLASSSPIVATAEVIGTEDSFAPDVPDMSVMALFRPWCGLVSTTEDAYYIVKDVLKGEINDSKIAVEHPVCWDTITVDGYTPALSPKLFKENNVLLLFLKPGSHQEHKLLPPHFNSVFSDEDGNCGAVLADGKAARDIAQSVRSMPDTSRPKKWLDEDVVWAIDSDSPSRVSK